MITLSDTAIQALSDYFKDREMEYIRICLIPGCHGASLRASLDEPNEDDALFETEGFRFCIHKELLDIVGGVSINFSCEGFELVPDIPLPHTEGSCHSCCGSCGSRNQC